MEFINENWESIAGIIAGLVTIASIIAKVTPNETDNKIVFALQKIIDTFAMSTGPTKLKK